jgi:Mrp family chromosome partitioning ATPase
VEEKKTCDTCGDSDCAAKKQKKDESPEEYADRRKLQATLCRIQKKIVVLSGKGGVGKSTVAVNLATALALNGLRVGLLDVDIHGPSVPTMLGLENETLKGTEGALFPVEFGGLKVMSLGFLLQNQDDAVIWRGPMKMGVIKQFLTDVHWGDLDYLIVDAPPGTGDEPLSLCQLIQPLDGAVIVTTPQRVAAVDVRKSISFCKRLDVPVLGVIENMSGFVCPKCGEITQILPSGGGKKIATDMNVPFLGAIPMDPAIAQSGDSGKVFIYHLSKAPAGKAMQEIINKITDSLDKKIKLNS